MSLAVSILLSEAMTSLDFLSVRLKHSSQNNTSPNSSTPIQHALRYISLNLTPSPTSFSSKQSVAGGYADSEKPLTNL